MFNNFFSLTNLLALIRQLIDLACVWAIVYYCLKIVKNNSRTIQLFKGVLLVVIVRGLASAFGLSTIANMADSIMNWGVVAIIVIFQPEIRSILEKIGKSNVFSRISTLTVNERESLVDELVKACGEMSRTKTGALISIEQGHSLSDYIKTGTPMNSVVSSELLCSIFQYGTPLHDGAVIIQGVKIACAAAYFPPTTRDLPTSYGARHRAAVGISEITDSITIIVSEETGNISIAENGKLSVYSESSLRTFLMDVVCQQPNGKEEKDENIADEDEESKKQGVFAHYFKGKNRRKSDVKDTSVNQKKKKSDEDPVVIDDREEKLELSDLASKQDASLDQLFENVSENRKIEKSDLQEEKDVTEKPKSKMRRKKNQAANDASAIKDTEKTQEETVILEKKDPDLSDLTNDLFHDVIEPEAIVLHYEKDDEERSDS